MSLNPLQQHFRQPKIYISLPSQGVYNKPGSFTGDVGKMPIFGMTGMDEIILKTPDSLLTGESTVKVMQSCCPSINDAWDVSMLDSDLILTAIRIATYGNTVDVNHTCTKCQTANEYALDLSRLIDHYTKCQFDNSIVLKELTIKIRPLTYKQSSEFKLKNFKLQQKLSQTDFIEDKDKQQAFINDIFKELGDIQTDLYIASIDSVQTGNTVVTEREYISEWLKNCDKNIFDEIKTQIDKNQKLWAMPTFPATCESCGTATEINLDLDQSNFFE